VATLFLERAIRRLISIPSYLIVTIALTASAPLIVPTMAIVSLFPKTKGALRTFFFILGYLWCDVLGICMATWLRLRWSDPAKRFQPNFKLQCKIINSLAFLAIKLYKLNMVVLNPSVFNSGPAIIMPRHASIADTLIPFVYAAIPHDTHLRYILKKELLIDPIFDILGNQLPNYFVDRTGQDTETATSAISELVGTLHKDEGLVIYPEGSRFSIKKKTALRKKHASNPDLMQQLDRWPNLLPPRLSGTMAVLKHNPGLDLVFCAHTGFEGSSHFGSLVNGSWIGATVQIKFWRIPFTEIPNEEMDRKNFFFQQWDAMEKQVVDMKNSPR